MSNKHPDTTPTPGRNLQVDTDLSRRTGLFTALLVLLMVLGTGGLLATAAAFPQQMRSRSEAMDAADPRNGLMGKLPGQQYNEEVLRIQREMTGELYDKMLPMRGFTRGVSMANMVISTLLLAVCIGVFMRKGWGLAGLVVVAALHIPFEWCRFVVLYKTAVVSAEAMGYWMPRLQEAQGGGAQANGVEMFGSIAEVFMVGSYGAMALAMTALYVFTVIYMRRPRARAVCSE